MNNIKFSRRATLLAPIFAFLATEVAFAQEDVATGAPFGVIEIGGSGVKPSTMRIVGLNQPDLRVIKTYPAVEANAVDVQNAPVVAKAVKDAIAQMVHDGIPANLIRIVGSSGVASNPAARDAVAAAVAKATSVTMSFVSVDDEVRYTFDGVVNKVRLAHRRQQVTLLDIGSGNTKGGYLMVPPGGQDQFKVFSIPFGTKSFARAVQKAQGDESIQDTAHRLAESVLRPAVQEMLVNAGPVLAQRNRIYLNGGIPWAVATTQNPTSIERYVPLDKAKIDRFCNLAIKDQAKLFAVDTSAITIAQQKALIDGDLKHLSDGSVFTSDEYVAGAELLRVLSEEMQMASKTLFFTRPGRVAWILGLTFNDAVDGRVSRVVLPSDAVEK